MSLKGELQRRQSERLQQLKREKNLKQQDLADAIGRSQQTISAIINGRGQLQEKAAEQLERAFGYRAAWLLGYDDCKTRTEFAEATFQRSMENVVIDLARRSGYEASVVTWAVAPETEWPATTEEDATSFPESYYVNIRDAATGEKRALKPEQLKLLANKILEYSRFLLWDLMRQPDTEALEQTT